MRGITFIENAIERPQELYAELLHTVEWDERMKARKTASFGVSYNYSQITYPHREFPRMMEPMLDVIEAQLDFRPNNCLINFYLDGKSTMGWHSDQTDILEDHTGVAIVSLGDERSLRFREIVNKENTINYPLPSGSLIYMTQEVQDYWQHCIPKSSGSGGRMSLTFRSIK